jgi:leucyl-tRNA synthetase
MFIGPPEDDVEWSDAGIAGVVRFLHRVWRLTSAPAATRASRNGANAEALRRKVHQTIRKVTEDYAGFRFNTAVAALMELSNAMQEYLARGGEQNAEWDEAVRALILLLHPMAPHITEELWEQRGERGLAAEATWPEFDPQAAAEQEVTLVVQVSGRVRDRIPVPPGLDQATATERALASPSVRRALGNGGQPSRIIYVPDRLINLVP